MKKKNKKLRIGIAGGYVLLIWGIVICGIVLFPISLNEPQFKITKEVCEKDTIEKITKLISLGDKLSNFTYSCVIDEYGSKSFTWDKEHFYNDWVNRGLCLKAEEIDKPYRIKNYEDIITYETTQTCTQEEVDEIEIDTYKECFDLCCKGKCFGSGFFTGARNGKNNARCTNYCFEKPRVLKQDLTIEILEENCECSSGCYVKGRDDNKITREHSIIVCPKCSEYKCEFEDTYFVEVLN